MHIYNIILDHGVSILEPSQSSSARCMCNVCMIYDPSPSIMHSTVLVFAEEGTEQVKPEREMEDNQ